MAFTPEVIDFLGIKIPTADFYPRPVVKTYYPRRPKTSKGTDRFYTPLQEATKLFILEKGAALTYQQTAKGFIAPVERLVGPTFFGEEAFRKDPEFYRNYAEPLGEATVITIDRRLRAKLYSYPGVRDRFEDELIDRKGKQGEMQAGLLAKRARARLAGVLPMLATDLRVTLTHQQLANVIGSTRETVSVNLGELEEMQLISSNGKGLLTLPPSSLDQLRDLAAEEKF